MANKAKSSKVAEKDRRAKVDALRREQLAKERRKTGIMLLVVVIIAALIVGGAAYSVIHKNKNSPANKSLASFGVSTSAASCSAVQTTKGTNTDALRTHVAEGTVEKYKTVPPSFGPHWPAPVANSRPFYTVKDRPHMEQLVHNLEHGYTIVWYDATVTGKQLTALKDLSSSARGRNETAPSKFIVSAWDDAYGSFPAGKHIGISHWGSATSHVQLCGQVSGAVVDSFIKKYPAADAPEPAAA